MVEEVAAPVTLPLDPPMANIHGQSFDTQIVLLFQSNDFLKGHVFLNVPCLFLR